MRAVSFIGDAARAVFFRSRQAQMLDIMAGVPEGPVGWLFAGDDAPRAVLFFLTLGSDARHLGRYGTEGQFYSCPRRHPGIGMCKTGFYW